MQKEQNRAFIQSTETLVKPEDVTAISFLGDLNRVLPVKWQQAMMKKGSQKVEYMGFVVDPYCFFLSYELKDSVRAATLLPEGYELLPTSLFAGDTKQPCLILGVFTARTSAFAGMRLEAYLIARRKSDGQAAWIIVDYTTNTNTYDPAHGFSGYDSDPALFTTTPHGELLVDVGKRGSSQRLTLRADLEKGTFNPLDYTLWVQGNLAVDYGAGLQDPSSTVFSLIFDPALMEKALRIPPEAVELSVNGFFADLIDASSPLDFACFPYSQHYVIQQSMVPGTLKTDEDLEAHVVAFSQTPKVQGMRGDDLKRPIFFGLVASAAVTYSVIAVLLFFALR